MAYWAIITRHPDHAPGQWTCGDRIYESRHDAQAAAYGQWSGTGVEWRLITIPGAED